MLDIYRLLLVSVFAWIALAQMDRSTENIRRNSGSQTKGNCPLHKYRQTAEEVLKNMKDEIEPCDDFYQFACGNFIEKVQIPKGKRRIDAVTRNKDRFTQQIRTILTEQRSEADPNHFKLANKFFKSCMNTTLIDNSGDEPVRNISNSLGGWPVVVGDSWDSDNSWNWQDLVKKLRRLGFSTNYIMTFRVGTSIDVGNETRNMIYLYEPSVVFESYVDKTSLKTYYDFMVDTAVSFGASKTTAVRELLSSLSFEMELIKISKVRNNLTVNLLSIEQLQELYPYVQWLDLINAQLPAGVTIDGNEIINLLLPSFFYELGKLLARTEKRTIANYIMWNFHYFSLNFLSNEFRSKRQEFDSRVPNTLLQKDRGRECGSLVATSLPISVSALYAHKYFNQVSKSTVTKIFENIRSAFSQILHESEWLDDETKAAAKRKLDAIKVIIGFPDELFDVGRVEEYFRALEIDEHKYFRSYLNITKFDLDNHFHQLRITANETKWLTNVVLNTGSPCYRNDKNEIHVPAACYQSQFLNTKRPNYMNYGSIGSVLAHEIIHGFCGDGCMYCPDGKEREWWKPVSMQALSEREKCFIEQYSNYTDKQTGLKINGIQTLEENIADNGGAKLSYLAYKQWQARHGEEPKLRGLKYTPQQLFWISFAQNYCSKFTPEKMARFIKKATHSPHEFRVLGVLRNMKDFSRDFHCPANSPMNPEKKCEVW